MLKKYSISSRLVITSRWFATRRLGASAIVKLVYCTLATHRWLVGFMWKHGDIKYHCNLIFQLVKYTSVYISRVREDSPIQAISFLTSFRMSMGCCLVADLYCPDTEINPTVLVAHLLRHLEEMASINEAQYLWYTISYPRSYPGTSSKHMVSTHLKDINLRNGGIVNDGSTFLISMDIAEMEKYLNEKAKAKVTST